MKTSHQLDQKCNPLAKFSGSSSGSIKKHYRLGIKMLSQIQFYQKSVTLQIRRASFYWLVWEVSQGFRTDLHFQAKALQEESEAYLVHLFEETNFCVLHTIWVIIMQKTSSWLSKSVVNENELLIWIACQVDPGG